MSKTIEGIIIAFNKGYRIMNSGQVLNPNGKSLKLMFDTKGYPLINITNKL